jgi:hypothetical protein
MQAKRVRQENNITEDVWIACRAAIRADHRLPAARGALETSWKKRLESMCCAASVAGAVAPMMLDGQVQYDETDDSAAKYERKLGGPARRTCSPERVDCEPQGISLPY